jgi:hypothetical protein
MSEKKGFENEITFERRLTRLWSERLSLNDPSTISERVVGICKLDFQE